MTEKNKETKPFVMFRTRQELVRAEAQNQLVLKDEVKKDLDKFGLEEVLGVTVTMNSLPTVVDIKRVDSPEVFLELAF